MREHGNVHANFTMLLSREGKQWFCFFCEDRWYFASAVLNCKSCYLYFILNSCIEESNLITSLVIKNFHLHLADTSTYVQSDKNCIPEKFFKVKKYDIITLTWKNYLFRLNNPTPITILRNFQYTQSYFSVPLKKLQIWNKMWMCCNVNLSTFNLQEPTPARLKAIKSIYQIFTLI